MANSADPDETIAKVYVLVCRDERVKVSCKIVADSNFCLCVFLFCEMMMNRYFTSLSTLFKSYQDDVIFLRK